MARLISVARAWENYRELLLPAGLTADQVAQHRLSFMTGCSLLYQLMMAAMDPGEEPTHQDLLVMELLHKELEAFGQELDRERLAEFVRRIRPAGRA